MTETEVRPFNLGSPALNDAARRYVDSLPISTNGVVLATVTADGDGAQLAVAARKGAHWSFVGILDKPYNGKVEGLVQARFEW